jgi:geranylgeranyl diphosphate synthase type II
VTSDPPAASRLADLLDIWRNQVDTALERFLPSPPACPQLISEAMRYSLFAGGKRLRPILTLASASAVARQAPHATPLASQAPDVLPLALPAACAIEMIHTYSLIHDDLPAMDDDMLRRGRPTAHVVFGEGIAILAGDALLTEAFHLLAREPATGSQEIALRKLRTIEVVAVAAGAMGMVGGQTIDLHAAGRARPAGGAPAEGRLDATALREMHARKTGALIRASAVAGALMAGAGGAVLQAIDSYAEHVGLAFQIVDDILDVEGSQAELGKTTGKDAAADKPTYPALFGLDHSKRLAADSVAQAHAALSAVAIEGPLHEIADWTISRTR